ncbi:MAG: uncharacterized protein QOF61_1064 [Acidobacteriota bacterium]|jgi:uncharacterized protein|nr:uncharacterized protein [Acidobacteriota bacterium]
MSQTAPTVEQTGMRAAIDDPVTTQESRLQPVAAGERIQLIDVLRGFALFGVLLANMVYLSGTDVAVTPERAASLATARLDGYVRSVIYFFVDDKANTIFAFLFGLGFAVQMLRAEERGRRIAPVYLRRLAVLLVIGCAHMFLLWYGDILHLYALVGFTLLLWRKCKDRTLLGWGAGLAVVPMALLFSVPWVLVRFFGVTDARDAAQVAADRAEAMHVMDARLAAFTHGTYFDVVRAHFHYNLDEYLLSPLFVGFALYVMGRFLLGLYVGRRRILHEAHLHLPLFRRLFKWSLPAAIVGNFLYALTSYLEDHDRLNEASGWVALSSFVISVGVPAMSCFYVSSIVLLFQRERGRRRLMWLAPVGRMALTNYLTQTLLHLFIFYGFAGLGLMGRVGTTLCVPISLTIFALQILYSRWWLARFRFGPCEWLWRTLTYGRRQPMRLIP